MARCCVVAGGGGVMRIRVFFLSSADFFLQNQIFRNNSSRNIIKASNSLDPDQAPDLGANGLQRLSADDTSIQRVEENG